jgi:multicomponent Na+:H+ antiporter subunit G
MIPSILTVAFLVGGTAFMVIATVGLIRLPDLYTRMHAVTKAGTLGILLVMVSVAVHFGDLSVSMRSVAVILFILLTAPVSAHLLGRAGYLGESELWSGTVFDHWGAGFDQLRRESIETEANARNRSVPEPADSKSDPDAEPSAAG